MCLFGAPPFHETIRSLGGEIQLSKTCRFSFALSQLTKDKFLVIKEVRGNGKISSQKMPSILLF
jgi:hypothetical protein